MTEFTEKEISKLRKVFPDLNVEGNNIVLDGYHNIQIFKSNSNDEYCWQVPCGGTEESLETAIKNMIKVIKTGLIN